MNEIFVYGLIVAAFMAAAWIFIGRDEDSSMGYSKDAVWKRMPGVFKLTWGFSTLFEASVGAQLAAMNPKRAEKLKAQAVAAALPLLTPSRLYAASFSLLLLCVLLGLVFSVGLYVAFPTMWLGFPPLIVLAMAALGWFWPTQNLARYTELRQEEMAHELPFAIDLIGSAMRSGLDFGAAMRYYVGNTSKGPLVDEFSQVLTDTTLGRPFTQSLADMATRVQMPSFSSFVGVVTYGSEIGAPIAQTLKTHGEDLRRERFRQAERKAARAPAVMIIPLVLFLMPSMLIIVLAPMFMRVGRVLFH